MSSRQKRKRRRRAAAAPRSRAAAPTRASPAGDSRSARKDAAARARLEPLSEGERPGAVTAGALVAAALGLVNLTLYAAGMEVSGERPRLVGVLAFSGLMLVAAWGMWHARYWAALGMQALLGLVIIVLSLALVTVDTIWRAAILVAAILAAGTLFWFMVKAMARIQMPRRDR